MTQFRLENRPKQENKMIESNQMLLRSNHRVYNYADIRRCTMEWYVNHLDIHFRLLVDKSIYTIEDNVMSIEVH